MTSPEMSGYTPPEAEQKIQPEIAGNRKDELIKPEIDKFIEIVGANFDVEDAKKINDALNLMIELHLEQKDRPEGRPYISHPLEVANDVVEKYEVRNRDLVIAALLHDTVEDQSVKLFAKRLGRDYGVLSREIVIKDPEALELKYQAELAEIALREIGFLYGDKVKEVVGSLSNPDFDSLIEESKLNGIEKSKNELYKEHVGEAIQNPDVCVIKYADFARNALALGNLPEGPIKDKFRKKYGPVIQEVFLPVFRSITEGHSLFGKKEAIIHELEVVYNEQYLIEEEIMKSSEMGMGAPEQKTPEQKQQMVTELGSLLHDEWRADRKLDDGTYNSRVKVFVRLEGGKEKWFNESDVPANAEEIKRQDIANTTFEKLDPDWQKDNAEAADIVVNIVSNAIQQGLTPENLLEKNNLEEASNKVHEEFLRRRKDRNAWIEPSQDKPYIELAEEEKEKDRAQVRKAIEISKGNAPEQKTPEGKEVNQPIVEVKYTEPGYHNDGNGNIEITIGNNTETIRLHSQYFKKETIDKIKTLLEKAGNEEDRKTIIDTVRTSVTGTSGGGYIEV